MCIVSVVIVLIESTIFLSIFAIASNYPHSKTWYPNLTLFYFLLSIIAIALQVTIPIYKLANLT